MILLMISEVMIFISLEKMSRMSFLLKAITDPQTTLRPVTINFVPHDLDLDLSIDQWAPCDDDPNSASLENISWLWSLFYHYSNFKALPCLTPMLIAKRQWITKYPLVKCMDEKDDDKDDDDNDDDLHCLASPADDPSQISCASGGWGGCWGVARAAWPALLWSNTGGNQATGSCRHSLRTLAPLYSFALVAVLCHLCISWKVQLQSN